MGTFDKQNVNTHQLESYHKIMLNRKDTLTPGSSQPEVFNVLGQLQTIERVKERERHNLKVPKEKLYLRNRNLELNPSNQKQSSLYKKVKDHIKKTGYIINPLLVVKDGDRYKVLYGNNRYLSGLELGFTEFPIQVLENDEVSTIREAAKNYKEINLR